MNCYERYLKTFGICIFCAFAIISYATPSAAYTFKSNKAIPENGWIYYTSGDLSRYENADNIKNIKYDSQGRIKSFVVEDGYYETTEHLHYEGNKVYNEEGDFLGYAYFGNQSPGVQAEEKETIKSETRLTTRLIRNRIAQIQAPRPKAMQNKQQQALKSRLEHQTAMDMAGGSSDQVAYEIDPGVATGMAAGEALNEQLGLGVWLSGGMSLMGNTASNTKFDGYSAMTMLGVDYRLTDRTVIGLGFGMEGSYIESDFYGINGESGSIGWTFAPYLSIALFDQTIFDIIGGVSLLSNGSTATAFHDSVRVMVSPNITQYFVLENWLLSASMGYTYARESSYDYSNSDNAPFIDLPEASFAAPNGKPDPVETGELRIGGRASYAFTYLMPFVDVGYIYDTCETEEDPDEVEVSMGLDIYPVDSFIISAEAAYSLFREDTYNARFMMNMRYEF